MKYIYLIFALSLISGTLFSQRTLNCSLFSPPTTTTKKTVFMTTESYIYNKPHYKSKTSIKLDKGTKLEYISSANVYYYKVFYGSEVKYVKRRYSTVFSILRRFNETDVVRPGHVNVGGNPSPNSIVNVTTEGVFKKICQ